MAWYAVFCQCQKEQLASRSLKERGFEVWWPYTTEWVGTGHKANSRLVRRPWLNRYLFVRSDKDELWRVNDAFGVSTVVYAPGGHPYPVPDKVMEMLFSKADHLGCVHVGTQTRRIKRFSAGQVIRSLDEKSPLFGLYIAIIKVLDNGSVLGMLQEQIAGTGKVFLSHPVIGEVVEGAA
jgi:transcription antitermination factor NusG